MLLAWFDPSIAQDIVRIRNTGSTAIVTLRMSPDYQRSWGWNLLPVQSLAPGETVTLPFNRRAGCFFDLLAVDADGREIPRFGQNLCGGKTIQIR